MCGKTTVLGTETFSFIQQVKFLFIIRLVNLFFKNDNIYKQSALCGWFPKEVENNMAKKSSVRQMDASNVIVAYSELPTQKRKEEAKQTLYIDRV
jgi:hypothetical protein